MAWLPPKAGIVVQDEVAIMDVVAEKLGDRLHRRNERAQMDRDVLALQDHLRPGVEERCRIIMREIEDGGARRLLERQRHLALGRLENAAHDRKGDRIDLGFAPGASRFFHRVDLFAAVTTMAASASFRTSAGRKGRTPAAIALSMPNSIASQPAPRI